MNKKDLDALNELYSSVYSGPEQLNEGNPYANTPDSQLTSNELLKKRNPNYGKPSPQQVAQAQGTKKALEQGKQIGMSGGLFGTNQARLKLDSNATKSSGRSTLRATPDTGVNSGSLDKSIRVGGTAYDRLTTKNGVNYVARKSPGGSGSGGSGSGGSGSGGSSRPAVASPGAPKVAPTRPAAPAGPAKPAVGTTPGGTKFERRTPTSSELRAAQAARAEGKGEEGAVKAGVEQGKADNIVKSGAVAALKPAAPTPSPAPARNGFGASTAPMAAKSSVSSATAPAKPAAKPKPETQLFSYQWPSAKTIREIAGAYASIYEAKKKVDQDEDGDNDFADVRVARMVASGMTKAQAIAAVRNKEYNEEFELDEGIGSAIRGLFSKKKEETPKPQSRGDQLRARYNVGPEKSDTSAKRQILNRAKGNAERAQTQVNMGNASQSYADKAKEAHNKYLKAGYSKYGADLPPVGRGNKARKRAAAMTPREIKEAYAAYEFVASYLLENNFASTVEDANVIINNMSEGWFNQIMEG